MLKVSVRHSAGFTYVMLKNDDGDIIKQVYVRPPGIIGRMIGRTYADKVRVAVDKMQRRADAENKIKSPIRETFADTLERFCMEAN